MSFYGFALAFSISTFIFNKTTHWANLKNSCFWKVILKLISAYMKHSFFSHEKVVITQFSENRWFYLPIYAKWFALSMRFTKQGNEVKLFKNDEMFYFWETISFTCLIPSVYCTDFPTGWIVDISVTLSFFLTIMEKQLIL